MKYIVLLRYGKTIPMVGRSKTLVCGLLLVGVSGSSPTGDIEVCLFWLLCVVR